MKTVYIRRGKNEKIEGALERYCRIASNRLAKIEKMKKQDNKVSIC